MNVFYIIVVVHFFHLFLVVLIAFLIVILNQILMVVNVVQMILIDAAVEFALVLIVVVVVIVQNVVQMILVDAVVGFVKNKVAVHIIEVVPDFALNLFAVDVMTIEVTVDYVPNLNFLVVVAVAAVGVIIQVHALVVLVVKPLIIIVKFMIPRIF